MNQRASKRILFAGGGTAGHLIPALNIALEIRKADDSILMLFVGRKNGMERDIVEEYGFEIREIDIIGMKRSLAGILKFIWRWRKGYTESMNIIRDFEPSLAMGTGGYLSAPVIRAAHKMGKPIFLQEQNSIPGLASRNLAKFADLIFTAYDSASRSLPAERCRLVGNPILPDILNADRESSYRTFGLNPDKKVLLILGGSSGARSINDAVCSMLNDGFIPEGWQILWQTGRKDYDRISRSISPDDISGLAAPFIKDIPGAYAVSDLVLSRAGAMVLSEITAAGLPSVLIPYPHATGDHQTQNARHLGDAGGALVIPELEMGDRLRPELARLFSDDGLRRAMSESSLVLGKPDAAKIIARTILERIDEV